MVFQSAAWSFKAPHGLSKRHTQGANSLIITVFGEEEQPGDGCEHALELVDRAAVAAAFPAEHPPCLHLCHGVLDGGADLAEDRVEFTLPVQEFRSAEGVPLSERHLISGCFGSCGEVESL